MREADRQAAAGAAPADPAAAAPRRVAFDAQKDPWDSGAGRYQRRGLMPAALPQLEETMTDQTVSDEVTEVDSDAEVAETETETETEDKPSGADTLENEGEIAAAFDVRVDVAVEVRD